MPPPVLLAVPGHSTKLFPPLDVTNQPAQVRRALKMAPGGQVEPGDQRDLDVDMEEEDARAFFADDVSAPSGASRRVDVLQSVAEALRREEDEQSLALASHDDRGASD